LSQITVKEGSAAATGATAQLRDLACSITFERDNVH